MSPTRSIERRLLGKNLDFRSRPIAHTVARYAQHLLRRASAPRSRAYPQGLYSTEQLDGAVEAPRLPMCWELSRRNVSPVIVKDGIEVRLAAARLVSVALGSNAIWAMLYIVQ